ncbi:MAG: cell envelope integrity protein TolA [Xanthomonadales bacterium]|nr:cell envelope integrity protein TolA [Xanthomonadales bacterium]
MQEFSKPLLLAVLVHLALLASMFSGSWSSKKFEKPRLAGLNIEAVVINASDLNKQIDKVKKQTKTRKQRDDAIAKRQQQLAAQKQREKQQAQDADKRQEALAEQRRRANLKKQQQDEANKKRRADLDRQRKAQEDLVKKQQAELAAVRKQREDQQRQIEAESAKLRKLAEARKAREKMAADKRMRDQMKVEANSLAQAQVLGTLADQYVLEITNSVTRNWYRPPTAQEGLRCRIAVEQIPGGEVISATVVKSQCNADEATRRSIQAAVMRAGVLPYRGFEKVFVREIEFEFKYDGD